jgi:hypothetical protein
VFSGIEHSENASLTLQFLSEQHRVVARNVDRGPVASGVSDSPSSDPGGVSSSDDWSGLGSYCGLVNDGSTDESSSSLLSVLSRGVSVLVADSKSSN